MQPEKQHSVGPKTENIEALKLAFLVWILSLDGSPITCEKLFELQVDLVDREEPTLVTGDERVIKFLRRVVGRSVTDIECIMSQIDHAWFSYRPEMASLAASITLEDIRAMKGEADRLFKEKKYHLMSGLLSIIQEVELRQKGALVIDMFTQAISPNYQRTFYPGRDCDEAMRWIISWRGQEHGDPVGGR
jgi:hypothetical protein